MKIKQCILADDFTGAADTAIQFTKGGYSPYLTLDGNIDNGIRAGYDILVINSETRLMDSSLVSPVIKDIVESCRKNNINSYFKKIDSTLRGNISVEIKTLLDVTDSRIAVVAPAAPRNSRTVVDGVCYVNGVPITRTESGNDPFNPVSHERIENIFYDSFKGKIEHIGLNVLSRGPKAFMSKVDKAISNGTEIIIADAKTVSDLKIVAEAEKRKDVLLVGSSGLAEAISMNAEGYDMHQQYGKSRALLVIGSLTETSSRQADYFSNNYKCSSYVINMELLLNDIEKEAENLLGALSSADNLPLILRTSQRVETDNSFKKGKQISVMIGKLVKEFLKKNEIDYLFVTGGDTAYEVVTALDAEGVNFRKEILPGIPLMKMKSRNGFNNLNIITKSGGFGNEKAIAEVIKNIGAV